MRSRSKFIACIALMAAATMAFSACGAAPDGADTTAPPATPSATADVAAAPASGDDARPMEGNLYLEGLPLVKETESFSLMVDDSGTPSTMVMLPLLEEQTNVKADIIAYPNDIAKEKKTIALTSGDYPDAIGGWIVSQKDVLQMGMNEGIFTPIDDLIEKYSPKMMEMLDQPGVRQAMTAPDDHIYSIPYLIGTPKVGYLPWINTEWLAKVGMDMPKTTDDLKAVLMAFKEQDVNGNGDPDDEIPFSGDTVNMNLAQLCGWFGDTFYTGIDVSMAGFTMRDGKLSFEANADAYKQFIVYMNDLYQNGLIDNELFTQTSDQWKAKGKQNLYGVCIAYGSSDFLTIPPNAKEEDYKYRPLPVIAAPGVTNPNFQRGSDGSTVFNTQVVITDKCKNPATIVRWFDNVFQLDNSVQINSGLEGVKIKKIGEGQYQDLDITNMSEADRTKYDWGNMYPQSLPKYVPVGFKTLPAEGVEPSTYDEKTFADDLYEPFLTQMIPVAWASEEDSARMSTLGTDIGTYVRQKQAEWITGQADVNKEWDAYVKQLDTLGLQEYIQLQSKAMGL